MTSNSQTHRNPYVGEGENGARRSAQIDPDSGVFHPEALIDWEAWAEDYDREGRGWSSTEHSRDEARPQAGELHAEMMALQTKIKDVIAREISLMLREVTLSCDHEDDGKTVAQLNEYREKTLEPKA